MTKSKSAGRRPPASDSTTSSATPSLDNPAAAGGLDPEITGAPTAEEKKMSPMERDDVRQQNKILETLNSQRLSGGYVEIHRRAMHESNYGFLDTVPVESFNLPSVKKLFGGGEYKFCAKTSRNQIVTTWCDKIDLRIPPTYPGEEKKEQAAPQLDVPALIGAVTEAIRSNLPEKKDDSLIVEMLRQNGEIVKAAMARPEPKEAGAGRLDRLEALVEKLIDKLADRPASREKSLRDQIEDFQAVQEIVGGNGEKKGSFVERLGEGIATGAAPLLQRLLGGQPELMPGLQPALQAPSAISPAAPGPDTSRAGAPNPPTDMNPMLSAYLPQFRSAAIAAALKQKNPIEWVDSLFDTIPERFHPAIFRMANSDGWFATFFGSHIEAPKHIEWLKEMRDAILTRAMMVTVREISRQQVTPENCANHIIASFAPSFHDALFQLTDPESWAELFVLEEINPAWLEAVRVALDGILNPPEPATATAPAAAPDPTPAADPGQETNAKAKSPKSPTRSHHAKSR